MRFGNYLGSRSGVVPIFVEQRKWGKVTITDPRMTRFWITLDGAARFVIRCLEQMQGGEIFVPKMASMKLLDMAQAVAPNCQIECAGIRPGKKLHEGLLTHEEARNSVETEGYVCDPTGARSATERKLAGRNPRRQGFPLCEQHQLKWLTAEAIHKLVEGAAFVVGWH